MLRLLRCPPCKVVMSLRRKGEKGARRGLFLTNPFLPTKPPIPSTPPTLRARAMPAPPRPRMLAETPGGRCRGRPRLGRAARLAARPDQRRRRRGRLRRSARATGRCQRRSARRLARASGHHRRRPPSALVCRPARRWRTSSGSRWRTLSFARGPSPQRCRRRRHRPRRARSPRGARRARLLALLPRLALQAPGPRLRRRGTSAHARIQIPLHHTGRAGGRILKAANGGRATGTTLCRTGFTSPATSAMDPTAARSSGSRWPTAAGRRG